MTTLKQPKTYQIEISRLMSNSKPLITKPMTLPELIKYFSYTLETGASYSHEKGNSKINTNPKTINALISALNKSAKNSGLSYQSTYYRLVE